jgi:hypothetical protein
VTHRALPDCFDFGQPSGMNNVTPIENNTKPAKERRVSKRVRHAIDLLVTGQCRTQKDAAEKAGLTRETLCRSLKQHHVIGHLERATAQILATSRAPAAATLLKLLTEARSEHVQKDCATTLLGINGISAVGERGPIVSINLQPAGYVVRLRHIEDADLTDGVQRVVDVKPNEAAE